ncbi:MAG: ChaN family lipoprotein [Sedimentitalea sp.]
MTMRLLLLAAIAVLAAPVWAASLSETAQKQLLAADIVILGEVHDNPEHHRNQARLVRDVAPKAVVWEMLTEVQAARFDARLMDDPAALAELLGWAASGWPAFEMYLPIFEAAPSARIYGAAVPRAAARAALQSGAAAAFGADAARYGLTVALEDDEQSARKAFQIAAHCDMLPPDRAPDLVQIQRLRDAVFARAALTALSETGGPVVVITGNGHARRDWGVPVYLARVRPGVRVFALGQTEAGQVDGAFDALLDAPAIERPDPCAAFHTGQ